MSGGYFSGNYFQLLPQKGIRLKDGTLIITGTGSPEGVETAPIGSWYTNTSNGDWYRKLSGTGNTGWIANTFDLLQDGTIASPSLAFASNTGSGMSYLDVSTGYLRLSTNGVERLDIRPNETYINTQTGALVARFDVNGAFFPSGAYAPGHVVQSVYSANSYQTSTTGATYTDVLSALATPWEISIAPKSTSSVIDLSANFQYYLERTAVTAEAGILVQRKIGAGAYSTIYTPVTDASGPTEISIIANGAAAVVIAGRHAIMLRDSPATTDVVTYKFQIRNRLSSSSPVFRVNTDTTTDGQSFVILNEVAV